MSRYLARNTASFSISETLCLSIMWEKGSLVKWSVCTTHATNFVLRYDGKRYSIDVSGR